MDASQCSREKTVTISRRLAKERKQASSFKCLLTWTQIRRPNKACDGSIGRPSPTKVSAKLSTINGGVVDAWGKGRQELRAVDTEEAGTARSLEDVSSQICKPQSVPTLVLTSHDSTTLLHIFLS